MDNSASSDSETQLSVPQGRVPPPDPDTIGGRLQALLTQNRVSMRRLANVLGASQPTVYKWVHNIVEPRLDTCRSIADFFKVSPEWICFGISEKKAVQQKKALTIDLTEADAERLFGAKYSLLVPVKIECSDMAPQFAKGDVVVDQGAKPADTDGVYLLRVGPSVLVRRITRRIDGSFLITAGSNAGDCPPDRCENAETLNVIGRIVGRLEVL